MVSLRRRRLLGLCSGNNSLVTQLPLNRENLTLYENSSQNANPQSKQSVVSNIGSILDNNSQNTVVMDEPGSSNVSCSNPSKEQPSQQNTENMKSLDSYNNLEVGKNVKARPVLERVAASGSGSNAGSPAVPPPSPSVESPCAVFSQTDGARVRGAHPLPPPSNPLKRGSVTVLLVPSRKRSKETVSLPRPRSHRGIWYFEILSEVKRKRTARIMFNKAVFEIHQKISSEAIDRKRELNKVRQEVQETVAVASSSGNQSEAIDRKRELNKVRQEVQETVAVASSSGNQLFSRPSTPYGGKMSIATYVLWY